MNSIDPDVDRVAARSRSVSRHRNRVAARLALFQSALNSVPVSSSSGANSTFVGGGFFLVVSHTYSQLRRRQRMQKRKMHVCRQTGYPYQTTSTTHSVFF